MRKYNLPIFIPHRGCPHDCVFCNQRKITGVDTDITSDSVRNMIKSFLETVDANEAAIEVAFFGGSFTGLDLETQESFLKVAREFGEKIDGIRLSTRPDYINQEVIELLSRYGVTTVELGVQSSDEQVLCLNGRCHTFEDVKKASYMIKEAGIVLGHQMMLGMYGSDAKKDEKTVEDIVSLAPECVRIYPVLVLKGTALEDLYKAEKYEPLSVFEAAERAKYALEMFRNAGIKVIRMGLHSSEDLEDDGNIVAGPYHQAFGEIVESLVYRDAIKCEIAALGSVDGEFEFMCPKGEVSKAVGHKKMNVEFFKKEYNLTLKVKEERK